MADEVDRVQEAEQLLLRTRDLSHRAATKVKRLVGESDALAVEVKSLQSTIDLVAKSLKQGALSPSIKQQALGTLKEATGVLCGRGPGGDLRRFCKPRNPLLLRFLLGDRTDVVAYRTEHLMQMKSEYHTFRDRAALLMLAAPGLLWLSLKRAQTLRAHPSGSGPAIAAYSFTPPILTGVQVYLALLAYVYVALALRENVLLVNGSAIRSWWICHHYWSAGCCLLLLALPIDSPSMHRFCEAFLLWSCFQAAIMFLYNRYQQRRMYKRVALGKDNPMDVVAGESSGVSGQLALLYPLLFALQVWEAYLGALCMRDTAGALLILEGWLEPEATTSDLRAQRGLFIVGAALVYMAIMNFTNTVATIMEKQKRGGRRPSMSSGGRLSSSAGGPPLVAEAAAAAHAGSSAPTGSSKVD